MFAFWVLWVSIPVSHCTDCSDFTVADCDPPDPIQEFPNFTDNFTRCEELCSATPNAGLWRLDTASQVCSILVKSSEYLSFCHAFSGPLFRDYDEMDKCMKRTSGDCQDLVEEDCQFRFTVNYFILK